MYTTIKVEQENTSTSSMTYITNQIKIRHITFYFKNEF